MSYHTLKQQLLTHCPTLLIEDSVPLSKHTTFRIGGACPLMVFPTTREQLVFAVEQSINLKLPCYIIGNGSNLLVADQGVDGFFINTKKMNGFVFSGQGRITVDSGVLLGKLANVALELSLTGLEFAHGIPGTVGGAVVMNAGAYGGEMCQVVESVTSFSLDTQTFITRTPEELAFSYRHSIFSSKNEVILSATLLLNTGNPATIQEKMNEFVQSRREKQPLEYPSCGSTFKRPPNHFAAALIDQCGLKGMRVGQAEVSEKHAGFVVNRGGATCSDVQQLVAHIQAVVLQETGIALELEVQQLPPVSTIS